MQLVLLLLLGWSAFALLAGLALACEALGGKPS